MGGALEARKISVVVGEDLNNGMDFNVRECDIKIGDRQGRAF